jgi:hypothetical protein
LLLRRQFGERGLRGLELGHERFALRVVERLACLLDLPNKRAPTTAR